MTATPADLKPFLLKLLKYHGGVSSSQVTTSGPINPPFLHSLEGSELVTVKKLEPVKGKPWVQLKITPEGRKLVPPRKPAAKKVKP